VQGRLPRWQGTAKEGHTMTTESDTTTFDGFRRAFLPDKHTTVIDVPENLLERPSVVVRYGRYTAVLDLMPQDDHLCIDVHPFVDGAAGRAAAFGMERGRRIELAAHLCPATMLGQPAVSLVSVLVGDQSPTG
jgi:hypothetical protein